MQTVFLCTTTAPARSSGLSGVPTLCTRQDCLSFVINSAINSKTLVPQMQRCATAHLFTYVVNKITDTTMINPNNYANFCVILAW